jgi:hypothetical protein
MSGHHDNRLISRAVPRPDLNLLLKPFTPDELISRVDQLTG